MTESLGTSPDFEVVRAPPSAAAPATSSEPNGRATVALQILDRARHGATAYLVRTRKDLVAALQAPVDGPVVLDVRIDPEIRLEGSQRTAALRQFRTE